jgi:hypothetical protein
MIPFVSAYLKTHRRIYIGRVLAARRVGLVLALFCPLVCSCDFPQGAEDGKGTLIITLPGSGGPERGGTTGGRAAHLPEELTDDMRYEIYLFGRGDDSQTSISTQISTQEKVVTVYLEPGLWDISVTAFYPGSTAPAGEAFSKGVDILPGQVNSVSLTMNTDEHIAPGGWPEPWDQDIFIDLGVPVSLTVKVETSTDISSHFSTVFPSDWTNSLMYQWYYEDENGARNDVTGADNLTYGSGQITLSHSPSTSAGGYFTYYLELTNDYTWKGVPATEPAKNRIQVAVVEVASGSTHSIGDTGPGGGTIFYKGPRFYVNEQPCHYLEVGPDLGEAAWGLNGTYVFREIWDMYGIGTGYANTQIILAALSGAGETGRAAQLAVAHIGGGQTDWFLPSLYDLNALHDSGHFGTNTLWSSTEISENQAYGRSTSISMWSAKTNNHRVRPIRAF